MPTLSEYRQQLDTNAAKLALALASVEKEKAATESLASQQVDAEAAQLLLQTVAAQIQAHIHKRIADVVSRCLAAVFDEPYTFQITFAQKRGRTDASITLERDGMSVDPMSAAGGGVVDVAAFALRLAAITLCRPPVRRLLVLDEPFRFVSVEYRGHVRRLVELLSQEMGIQFVIVTHQNEMRCGKVVEV